MARDLKGIVMPVTLTSGPLRTRICRWGNSTGVRLPRAMLAKARLAEGTTVKVQATSRGILLSPDKTPRPKRKYTLRQLCKGMTPAKSHPEFAWGAPVGSEVI
jgi:antitoxin MazE